MVGPAGEEAEEHTASSFVSDFPYELRRVPRSNDGVDAVAADTRVSGLAGGVVDIDVGVEDEGDYSLLERIAYNSGNDVGSALSTLDGTEEVTLPPPGFMLNLNAGEPSAASTSQSRRSERDARGNARDDDGERPQMWAPPPEPLPSLPQLVMVTPETLNMLLSQFYSVVPGVSYYNQTEPRVTVVAHPNPSVSNTTWDFATQLLYVPQSELYSINQALRGQLSSSIPSIITHIP